MNICYIILTCEKFLPTRAHWQNSTFLQKVNKKDVFFYHVNQAVKTYMVGIQKMIIIVVQLNIWVSSLIWK